MISSTPQLNGVKRKSQRHLRETDTISPLRRSSVLNTSSAPLRLEEDDENERRKRRSLVSTQRQLSSSFSSNLDSPKVQVPEHEIKTHFDICIKMFTENKINIKNAWNLKIIDYMRSLLQSNKLSKDSLQIASTSLDVSTKVYGIRVDDIHSDGLKLASNMARVAHNAKNKENQHAEGNQEGEQNDENAGAKKKKKQRRLSGGSKHTISKDINNLVGDIPKLESAFFLTRTNSELSTVDNLFTNRIPKDHSGCKFMLLNKSKYWCTYNETDYTIQNNKMYPYEVQAIEKMDICSNFESFEVDVWDPDNDELEETRKSLLNDNEVVYDDKGIPIPELDGSIHDIFNEPEPVDYGSSGDEDCAEIAIQGEVANINSLQPDNENTMSNEYMYQSFANCSKFISQIWAGPSHWKLKHLQRAASRFSGTTEKLAQVPAKKRTKHEPEPLNFKDHDGILPEKTYLSKKYLQFSENSKNDLPLIFYYKTNPCLSLLSKNVFMVNKKHEEEEKNNNDNDREVNPFNYENPNDSQYCSQSMMQDDDNGAQDGDMHEDYEEEIAVAAQNQQFVGENLIDLPDIVPKTQIGYATQAKKMDMKKLKNSVWKILVDDTNTKAFSDEIYKKSVCKTTFSEIYKKLPSTISLKMSEELSSPLAFIAILHLANEQSLKLTGQDNLSDFQIEKDFGPHK